MSATADTAWERYTDLERWLVTAGGIVGMMAMVLSSTSTTVAVPDIMGAFGVGQDQVQWTSTGYFAAMTGTMLLTAWLVARFGQRAVFLATMLVFVGAVFLGTFAPSIDLVILARVMQGACAGIIQPLAMTVIFTVFPPARRGMAMGIFGLGVVIAPAIGPTLGGVATDGFGWRYVFLLPLPFVLAAFLLGYAFMPGRVGPPPSRRFDWLGFGLLSAALGLLLDGMASGQRLGWDSDAIVGRFLLAALATTGFVARQRGGTAPLLDMKLFANPEFASAAIVAFVFGFGMFGSIYIFAVFLQQVQNYTALEAGIATLPAGLLMVVMFPTAGRLNDSFPAWAIIVTGLLCFGFGFWLMAGADPNTPFWTFIGWTLVNRVGLSLIIPSLNTGALRALRPDQVAQGSGLINFARTFGGAAGVNGMVLFLEMRTARHADLATATQSYGNGTARSLLDTVEGLMLHAGVAETQAGAGALHYLGQVVHAQASAFAFQDTFLFAAALSFLALLPAVVMARSHRRAHA